VRWDIFCRVVDNFGDAGISWRLARQLAREHGIAVTLWIDDVASLASIVPGLQPDRADQPASGMRVRTLASMAPGRVHAARSRRRSVRMRPAGRVSRAMAERAKAAGLDRARVLVRRAVDRRIAWPSLSSPVASAHPLVLVPRLHAEDGGVLREHGLSRRATHFAPMRTRARRCGERSA
jgi:hypothetical protein